MSAVEDGVNDLVAEFLDAARFGELDELVRLKEAGVDPHCTDAHGTTALHRSAANGHVDVVKYLLDTCTVNPNVVNENGNTALHWATVNACVEVVNVLLASTALDADAVTKSNLSGVTPLNEAHRKNCEEIEITMLEFQERKCSATSSGATAGTSEQHMRHNHEDDITAEAEIAEMLLNRDSSPDAKEHPGTTDSRSEPVDGLLSTKTGKYTDTSSSSTHADGSFNSKYTCTTNSTSSSGTVGGVGRTSTAAVGAPEDGSSSSCTVVSGGWFRLNDGLRVYCAEAAPGQEGGGAVVERTGDTLWSSSIVGALSVSKMAAQGDFSGRCVVELGAGCGLLSLAALFGVTILSKLQQPSEQSSLSSTKVPTVGTATRKSTQFFVTDADDLALKTSLRNFKRTCVGHMSSRLFYLKSRPDGWINTSPVGLIDSAPIVHKHNSQFDSTAYRLICTDGKLCDVAFENMNWAHAKHLARPHTVDIVLGSDLIYELGEEFEQSISAEMEHDGGSTSIRSTAATKLTNSITDDHITTTADTRITSTSIIATDAISTATDTISTATDTIRTATDTISTATDTISTATDTISTATDTISTATDTISTATDTISTATDTISTATDTISTATDTISTATDTISTATGADPSTTTMDNTSTSSAYAGVTGVTRRCPCNETCSAAQLALCIDSLLKKDSPTAKLCYFYQPDSLGADAFVDHLQRRGFDCKSEAVELDRPLDDVLEFCSAEEVRALFPCLSSSGPQAAHTESDENYGVLASDFALLTAKRRIACIPPQNT